MMTKPLVFFWLTGVLAANTLPTQAQPAAAPVRYAVAFPNAAHHEARISATFAGLPAGPLRVCMARSSPGRYSLHDFAKNVYSVTAQNAASQPLPLDRTDPYSWVVTPGPDGTVVFGYTLYGDRSDGTYAGIDEQHAHLNAPATFCYAPGLETRACEVQFEPLPGWKIATQLRPAAAPNSFEAPNLQYLMDSPVVLGNVVTSAWAEGGQTIEMATLYRGPAADVATFVQATQRIVREEKAIFGELPAFDFGRYTFLGDYLPQANGDGMEHRNSTSLTSARPLTDNPADRGNLATVAHEFFHAWNVERLRPADLEPFDFERTNMSDALWFAEGFTQYYGELVLRRVKIYDDAAFFDRMSYWISTRQHSPGARLSSAVDNSRQATFLDQSASVDPTNKGNTTISYYTQGAGIALALDLELRTRYRSSLDKYMQALWQERGKYQANYAPARPYTLADLQRVLGTVSRDSAFAGRFFRRYVRGHEPPRFAELLLPAGLAVVPGQVPGPALLQQVDFDANGRCFVAFNTTIGSGLYQAGIDRGDQLMALDGKPITGPNDLADALRPHAPTDVVPVVVKTRGGLEKTVQLSLAPAPVVLVQPIENAGKIPPNARQKALRAAWLGSQAGE